MALNELLLQPRFGDIKPFSLYHAIWWINRSYQVKSPFSLIYTQVIIMIMTFSHNVADSIKVIYCRHFDSTISSMLVED